MVISLLLAQAQLERMVAQTAYADTIVVTETIPLPPSFMVDHDASIKYWALKEGISYTELEATIKCESGFNPNAIGDNGTSFGLAQFHNPEKDWGFSKEKALEPDFAIQQMAIAFNKSLQNKWSCYRLLYEQEGIHR